MSTHDGRSYAMTNLFLLHASEDAARAETLRTSLTIQGYSVWCEPLSLQVSDILDPHTIENAILGSAVVLLLWSRSASRSAEVARHLPFALHLKKTILLLMLDQTGLPASLRGTPPFVVQERCADIVTQLMQQSLLPSIDSDDPLFMLAQLAASSLLSERKAAIQQASAMLQRNEQRAAVLAILTYLVQHDLVLGVRELAQEVLDANPRKQQTPQPPPFLASLQTTNAADMIEIRCKKCANVTYFDKCRICKEARPVTRGGKTELKLKCGTCDETMVVQVDCEGYK